MEHVGCDLCGANDSEVALELRDRMFEVAAGTFQLVRCRRCGLLYLNPRPTSGEIDRFYQEDYAPFARSGIAERAKRWTIDREVRTLWRHLAPPANVLDVGCATGDLLQAIRTRGNPSVLGIEPSPHAADLARSRWGVDVITGRLETVNLPAASVDTALMAHTIEHLPSPSETLEELHRVLTPGGTLILWLPNADSVAAQLLGEWWIGYDAPRHFFAFTPDTLTGMLNKHGMVVRSISHEWIGLEWSWALRLLARDRISSPGLNKLLSALHLGLTAAFTPLAAASALLRRAGRIRVVAIRQD